MKEVEILVELAGDKDGALSALRKFDFKGIKKTTDFYFYDPLRTNLRPDATGRLKECFRLRSKNGKYFLTYKVDNFDKNGKWLYSDEHETEVYNFECANKIINHLGLKPLVTIDNEKHTFMTKEYEIVLEDVKDLGLFLEVECITVPDDANIIEVKKNVWKFMQSLGLKVSEELNLGKPELMLRKIRTNGS